MKTENDKEKLVDLPRRWIVRLSEEDHYRLKQYCAKHKTTQQKIGETALKELLCEKK
jgi:hypothetical protein